MICVVDQIPQYGFWGFAFVVSTFHALAALHLFGQPSDKENEPSSKENIRTPWYFKTHQIWLNFAGSLVGWGALAVILRKASLACAAGYSGSIDLSELLVALVAFVGICGYLPAALVAPLFRLGHILEMKFGGKRA